MTGFRFRTHRLETVLGGLLFPPATPEVISGFLAEADADELSTIANVMTAPPVPFLPAEQGPAGAHGLPVPCRRRSRRTTHHFRWPRRRSSTRSAGATPRRSSRRSRTPRPRWPSASRACSAARARVPEDATAFAHRDRRIMTTVAAVYARPEEREAHAAWVGGLASALRHGERGPYVGFLGDEGPQRVRAV